MRSAAASLHDMRIWCVAALVLVLCPTTLIPWHWQALGSAHASSPKRLVLCLDGTWAGAYNEAKREDGSRVLKPTNPLKLCRAVIPFDETTSRPQIAYYSTGVGGLALYPGPSNQLLYRADRILGGGWGAGFEENVESALHFLVSNFEPGDEVFIFGFSRGAATARAVTRFLDWNHGLPEKADAYYLPGLFRAYVVSRGRGREAGAGVGGH